MGIQPVASNRKGKPKRRRQHDSAWHWKRVDNKEAAQTGIDPRQTGQQMPGRSRPTSGDWAVAKVCDVYLDDLHQTAISDVRCADAPFG